MLFPKLALQLNALPPALAHICLRIRTFMREHNMPLPNDSPVIVGVSGGADSTALVLILRILGYPVHIAHLDHALRPESKQEAEHVKVFASQYQMPYSRQRIDVRALAASQKIGIEEAGRHARYAFFSSLQNTLSQDPTKTLWLATGHHAHDLAEDILMRLLRGTAWPALGGMRAVVSEKHLMRPLLTTSKDDLTSWLTNLGIPWCHDPSNDSVKPTRNRIRHRLIPLCFEENPHFLTNIKNLWTQAQDDHAYWTQRMTTHMPTIMATNKGMLLPRHVYKDMPKAERLRLYKNLIKHIPHASPRASTLFALDKARFISGKQFQYSKACITVTHEGLHVTSTISEEL